MEKRFEGFLAPHGLYILDTFSGEVRFIQHSSSGQLQNSSLEGITLNTTLPEQKNSQPGLSPFENEVVSSYPYLIAKPFADLLQEKDARMKCKLMVDTFTAVLKYLALQLASEYLRAKDVKDIQVHQTLTKDLSRPLISAWNLLIARCLPVLTDHKVPLFSPEIKAAYEKLESKCKDPKLVEQKYSDENGEIKTKTKKLGKIQALINYRNGLAHGFNQSQTRAQKEFDEYYPLLCDILQEVRFVSRYTLWHVESNREGVNGMRLMGANPTMNKIDFDREGINPAISPLFLINDGTGEILPLYAFFDVDEAVDSALPDVGKDIFVFEGNTKNTVIYLSSSGEHLEKSSRFQHWKELLAQKQFDVEWADSKNLSIEILNTIGKYISSTAIQALIASGKYLPEASIPRQDLNELLDSFSFGTFNGFVLGGESGIGKSTLLAKKTEEWQAEGHMVALYRGSALNQSDVANKFLRDCALKVSYLEDFLSIANPLFSNSDKKCYLIIDALNEYAGDLNELIQSVDNIVAQAGNFSWFKVIVSIRDSAYNRVRKRFGEQSGTRYFVVEEDKGAEKIKSNIVRLQPVAKEFVELLYNAYRDFKWKDSADTDAEGYYKFRPLTTFNELNPDGSTINLIKSPLMARLIMQSFHRSRLPQQLNNDDAMRLYYDNIVLEKTEDQPGFPERKKFLALLVSEMDKLSTERLERDELMKNPAVRNYLIGTQRDSAYIQLLDLGVLMEEWEADECYLRFAFDKFLEFLLAELHWPRINDAQSLLELSKKALNYKILQGAIEIILFRFCLNHQFQQFVELIDISDKENDVLKALIKDIGSRLLMQLSNEKPLVFDDVVNDFPKKPCEMDLYILLELLDKLYLTGQLDKFEKILNIATYEAEILDNQKILSDLMLSAAQNDLWQGRFIDSRIKLENALIIKKAISDIVGELKTARKLCELEWRLGNVDVAIYICNNALEISQSVNNEIMTADFKNVFGVLQRTKGEIDEAIKTLLSSLLLYDSLNDVMGKSLVLNNLGKTYYYLDDFEQAENYYLQVLNIKRELNDKTGLGVILNNLGSLSLKMNKLDEALTYFNESLLIKKSLKEKVTYLNAIHNSFSIFEPDEREKLFIEVMQMDNKSFKDKEQCWLLDIQLMHGCLNKNQISTIEILTICDKILELSEQLKLNDIDDLPVEAFYIAANKLTDLKNPEAAINLAKKAIEWIGDRKTRRKIEFEKIINLITY